MTALHVDISPAIAAIRIRPALRVDDDVVIGLPVSEDYPLVDGVATIELDPSTTQWCYESIELGLEGVRRYWALPDSGVAQEYAALPDVDPFTFEATVEAVAAWDAVSDEVQAGVSAAAVSAAAAAASAALFADPDTGRAALRAQRESVLDVRTYGAVCDCVAVATGAMTASSAVLVASGAGFTSAAIGKSVIVRGAGVAGAPLVTTIGGYTNTSTVTLAATASTAVTNTDVAWGTDDAAAIQAAVDAAAATGGLASVAFAATKSMIKTGITLSASVPIHLSMPPTGGLVAGAAMGALITKPAGATASNSLFENVNLYGLLVADRCLDVLQAHKLTIRGGILQDALVCVADFGRGGAQCFEMYLEQMRIIGCLDTANRPSSLVTALGLRFAATVTDSFTEKIIAKNCTVHITDAGSGNVHSDEHCFNYPIAGIGDGRDYNDTTVAGWSVTGSFNTFNTPYVDMLVSGFIISAAGSNTVINGLKYGASSAWTYAGVFVVIDTAASSCTFVNGTHKIAEGATYTGYGLKLTPVASVSKTVYVNQTFTGGTNWISSNSAWPAPIDVQGAVNPNGSYIALKRDDLNIRDHHTAGIEIAPETNGIILLFNGSNPGRVNATGSGASGYLTFKADTSGAGVQLGSATNKVGFYGTTPVAQPSLTAVATDPASTLALANSLRAALVALGIVT